MGHSSIRLKVRRRKVANLAAISKKFTVSNSTIPKIINPGKGEWDIPEEGYPQPKRLKKKYKKKYYNKDGTIRKILGHASDWKLFKDRTFHPKGRAWFMEQIVQHKLAKWEKKNPCPVKPNQNPPDMFEEEFVIPWKAKKEAALEHIRDVVVSMYDKLPLTGRFKETEKDFVEEHVKDIKDTTGEGFKINELNPKTSTLLKKVQKETNRVKAKRPNLMCTNLKDHKRQKGRLILPQAA